MSEFVHLHLHTQYSLLDGVNKIKDITKIAANYGQQALAITDHGNMHGAIEFYDAANKQGIKPILGCELYVTSGSRFDRTPKNQGGAGTNHLTVLAHSNEGYYNLCRLVTLGYREGFYFKPRVDHELLERYNEGLIVLSGCLASEVGTLVSADQWQECKRRVEKYAGIFKDRYYLEVQPHAIGEQAKLNSACLDLAKEVGLPVVATTDCHYPSKDFHFAQEVLMCIATAKQINDPSRIQHVGVDLHLKTTEEMYSEFGDWPKADEAIKHTYEIANRCNLNFDFSKHFMPRVDTSNGESLDEMMRVQAEAGLERRFELLRETPDFDTQQAQVYRDRLEEEIGLISKMGFSGYFLVVADFINWAKEEGIPVGPGRGSAAGSLVAYSMRITEIDPIVNKLLFERFLNPARISLPDIDVDFCIYGRDQVIKYVVEKYGKENVAQIATFGTLKAKAAIKDVGRVLGVSYAETDKVAQLVPAPRQGFDYSLEESLEMEPRLKEYAEGDGEELISLALKLEGLTRHTSTHAAGVVIGDRPLIDMLPMMVDKDGNDVTQYSMKYVEQIGLVKFDFLGLKTLTVIQKTLDIIQAARGQKIDLNTITLDDEKTFDLLCRGIATGIFQLEGTGITEMTMRLKPNCFDDLVATIALYRPGPLDAGMVDHYIDRKHGVEEVSYLHPTMEEILKDTYGIILYQEQIMQLARTLAGYSLGEADLLRRAMGKKVPEEMALQRDRFVSGAQERQIPEDIATEIFDQMETFARYGFNRSHSAAYALISYQTAYLKAHYGVEFMAALMSLEMGDTDKTLKNVTECTKQAIQVLPPDVNHSESDFSVIDNAIRYGLAALKGVGEKAVEAIVVERKASGPFIDLEDFAVRVDMKSVNKRVFESLVKSGSFDCFSYTRRDLLERLDDVIRAAQSVQRERDSAQVFLFGDGNAPMEIPRRPKMDVEFPVNHKLALEREALGFYLSGHPLQKFKRALAKLGTVPTVEARKLENQARVKIGGVVTALRLRNTKKGDRYAGFILEDSQGTLEALVWPRVYNEVSHLLVDDDPVVVEGRLDVTDERCVLIVDTIDSLISMRNRSATQGLLVFSEEENVEQQIDSLRALLQRYPGKCPVKAQVSVAGKEVAVLLRDGDDMPICIEPSEDLADEAEQLFGRPILAFV